MQVGVAWGLVGLTWVGLWWGGCVLTIEDEFKNLFDCFAPEECETKSISKNISSDTILLVIYTSFRPIKSRLEKWRDLGVI